MPIPTLLAGNAASEEKEKEAILAIITRMEAAWNRRDFRGYMEGFVELGRGFRVEQRNSEGLAKACWTITAATMALQRRLAASYDFSIFIIEILAPVSALLNCRFQLDRAQSPLEDICTRLLR